MSNEAFELAAHAEPDEPSLRVDVFRHGKARYGQDQVPIEEAHDLTPEGALIVQENANKLADSILPGEEVAIWASPTGRTLETAKIIARVFRERGIPLRQTGPSREDRGGKERERDERNREDGHGIKVFKELQDIKNFSREIFLALVDGGEIEFGGRTVAIDKNETNPQNLGPTDYWITDAFHRLPQEVKDTFPRDFVEEVEGFEKFYATTARIIKPLARLQRLHDKSYRVIIVTHNGMATFLGKVFSHGETLDLSPGEFINLERKNDKLAVTRIGDRREGKNDTDVIQEFKNVTASGEREDKADK